MSPTKAQTLLTRAFTTDKNEEASKGLITDKINLVKSLTEDDLITTLVADKNNPLLIKSNKVIQSSTIETDVTTKKLTSIGQVEEIIADLKLKVFGKDTLQSSTSNFINLNNFGDGNFTSINFKEQLTTDSNNTDNVSIPLNILVPENNFGLIMIYYKQFTQSENKASVTSTSEVIRTFNNDTTTDTNEITLNQGINIIRISNDTTLSINSKGVNDSTIIFSGLSLISTNDSEAINPKLCYKVIDGDKTTALEQLLSDIKTLDTDKVFYYNLPIASNLDIDMNERDLEDNLENPLN
jgi:hypothetical protein